jgi:hypothetical protein
MRYLDKSRDAAVLAADDSMIRSVSQPVSALLTRDTAELVRKYAASLQQLISADGLAVAYGSSRSMICVASSGFGAPQLDSELCHDGAATEAIRLGRTVVQTWGEASLYVAQSCVAVPAPKGAQCSTLLIVYGPKGDTLGDSGMRMLEAAAEYLAFIITAAAPTPEAEFGYFSDHFMEGLDCGPSENARAGNVEREADHSSIARPDELPYFDAPVFDAPAVCKNVPAAPAVEVLGQAAVWEQFDLLDGDERADDPRQPEAASVAPGGEPEIATAGRKPSETPVAIQDSLVGAERGIESWGNAEPGGTTRRNLALRFAACGLLVLAAGLLLTRVKGTLTQAPPRSSSTAQLRPAAGLTSAVATAPTLSAAPPAAASVAVPTGHRASVSSRVGDLAELRNNDLAAPRNGNLTALREKALGGDAAARMRLADALAKSSDPALHREAYAWYIIAGEDGDVTATERAQKLNREIPQNNIGDVRQRVAGAFAMSQGAARNLPKAYEWYLLAENSGANVQHQLEDLRQQMSPAQVRLATSTANAWLERHRMVAQR